MQYIKFHFLIFLICKIFHKIQKMISHCWPLLFVCLLLLLDGLGRIPSSHAESSLHQVGQFEAASFNDASEHHPHRRLKRFGGFGARSNVIGARVDPPTVAFRESLRLDDHGGRLDIPTIHFKLIEPETPEKKSLLRQLAKKLKFGKLGRLFGIGPRNTGNGGYGGKTKFYRRTIADMQTFGDWDMGLKRKIAQLG